MLIKTLLNKCYPVKGFTYGKVGLHYKTVLVKVKEREGSRGLCSQCNKIGPT